jgi:YD repeat-containing protein
MGTRMDHSRVAARWATRAGPVAAAFLLLAFLATRSSGLAVPASPPPIAAGCSVQALGTLGGMFGNAVAVNRQGVAVGIADDAKGVAQPVLWRGRTPQRLITGLSGSVPLAVNAAGQVIGTGVDTATGSPAGWAWSRGRATRLKAHEHRVAWPEAINDHGVIVGALLPDEGGPAEASGHAGEDDNDWAAVWASPTSDPVVLRPLRGDQGAHAFAVNGRGRAAGVSQGAKFTPVVWEASGQPRALPTLGGGYGIVRGLSDSGIAVGDAVRADGTDHAVMWDAAGRITDLVLPAGARSAKAETILPNGVIVGTAELPVPGGGWRTQAVQWTAPGAMQVLPSAAGAAANASGSTTVAGYRADGAGGRHPTLWRCER